MPLLTPPDPPAAGVTDQLSWQQWDIYLRYQDALVYQQWMDASQANETARLTKMDAQTAAFQAQATAMQAAAAASKESADAIAGPTPPHAPMSDADLTLSFTNALLSDWDWSIQSKAAPATVVSTAAAMKAEFRKLFPAGS